MRLCMCIRSNKPFSGPLPGKDVGQIQQAPTHKRRGLFSFPIYLFIYVEVGIIGTPCEQRIDGNDFLVDRSFLRTRTTIVHMHTASLPC